MTMKKRRKCDNAVIERVVEWLELEGYQSLKKSNANIHLIGREWFSFIGKLVDIYDTDLNLINESELMVKFTFLFDDKFYTVAYLALYTENGIRGYTEDGDEIYGFVEGEEIYNRG